MVEFFLSRKINRSNHICRLGHIGEIVTAVIVTSFRVALLYLCVLFFQFTFLNIILRCFVQCQVSSVNVHCSIIIYKNTISAYSVPILRQSRFLTPLSSSIDSKLTWPLIRMCLGVRVNVGARVSVRVFINTLINTLVRKCSY